MQIKSHPWDAPALNSSQQRLCSSPHGNLGCHCQQQTLTRDDGGMSKPSLGGFRHDTSTARSVGSLDVPLGATPGTPLFSFPIWPLSDLCSLLLPGFTLQNPDIGKVLKVVIDVQPLGKPLVLFVLFDRQIHSPSVAAARSPVPSSLENNRKKPGCLNLQSFFFLLPRAPSMVFGTFQSKYPLRWQVPMTLLATREQGSFPTGSPWGSQRNDVLVFAGKPGSSRGVAGTRLTWCWGLGAF